MKGCYYLILITIIGYVSSDKIAESDNTEPESSIIYTKKFDKPMHNPRRDVNYFETPHVENYQLEEKIYHPCEFCSWNCIRSYLAKISDCKPVQGSPPDPVFIPRIYATMPVANMSAITTNVVVEGLKSAKIIEFYHNKKTDKIVISFHLEDMVIRGFTYYIFQRKNKESIVTNDKTAFTYPDVLHTSILSSSRNSHFSLNDAEHVSYVLDLNIGAKIGPKAFASQDPEVKDEWATFQANLPIISTSYSSQISSTINTILIQRSLCDFGI